MASSETDKNMQELKEQFIALSGKLEGFMVLINSRMDAHLQNQADISAEHSKTREELYRPSKGLFSRVQELEAWKSTVTKLAWIMVSAMVYLVGHAIWSGFDPG